MANPYQKLGASSLEGREWIEVEYESPRSYVRQTRAGVVIDAFSHPRDSRDVHKIWFREAESPHDESFGTAPLFELVFGNDADTVLRKSSANVESEAAFMYVPPASADVETRWTRLNDARNPNIDVTIEHKHE
jgi:hypothetical protein